MKNAGVMEENTQGAAAESDAPTVKTTALGLDVGTSRIVLADGPDSHKTRTQLNAFVTVAYSKMAEDVVKQKNMVYERNGGQDLYVYGNDSDFFASLLNTVPRRPMQHGVLIPQEKKGQ